MGLRRGAIINAGEGCKGTLMWTFLNSSLKYKLLAIKGKSFRERERGREMAKCKYTPGCAITCIFKDADKTD